jgi:hypothetical protein
MLRPSFALRTLFVLVTFIGMESGLDGLAFKSDLQLFHLRSNRVTFPAVGVPVRSPMGLVDLGNPA